MVWGRGVGGLGFEGGEELFEVGALGVVGVVVEVVVQPFAGGFGHTQAGEDEGEVALEVVLAGPEEHFHFEHGADVGELAGAAERAEEVLHHPGEPHAV